MRIYDRKTKRLICYRQKDWDEHWSNQDIRKLNESVSKHNIVNRVTRKYLKPEDGLILEGGCGLGQFVHSLSDIGYDCVGIDTAQETIAKIKSTYPDLNVNVMDISNIEYPSGHFAGYWSLGVIEHIPEGYEQALQEMYRVIKPGGYVFVAVPIMSLLRRLKVFLRLYKTDANISLHSSDNVSFYQFVFYSKKLINDFQKIGFRKISSINISGIKGFGDEIPILKSFLRRISSLRQKNLAGKCCEKALDILLSSSAGHTALFVFQK
ncbi:MAG: class I SAM-dependent methyltransferase [Bacteroidetes bacterium]|nr:class I SAM-dependent methyltransferase [Bacteroidota bacterium]